MSADDSIHVKRALVSCWDKTGLLPLAQELIDGNVEIVSSGGTAKYFRENNILVTDVSEITGFPEILNGRVKTLHPAIHGGILAKRTEGHLQELREQGILPIDLVVVNLYPFPQKMKTDSLAPEKMVEYIDIGGPAMLRAAAKNFRYVVCLYQPEQYQDFLEVWKENGGQIPVQVSREMAAGAFFYTAWYDSQIAGYLSAQSSTHDFHPRFSLFYQKSQNLRYGENPHQQAAFYTAYHGGIPAEANMVQLWGKEMSYNNYVDVSAAAELAREFKDPFAAIIKHTNPCGAASADTLAAAFTAALSGDPLSAFGGIVAVNRPVDRETASHLVKSFYECVIAPGYEPGALEILQQKKNLRILLQKNSTESRSVQFKQLPFGLLMQEPDGLGLLEDQLRSVGAREPDEREKMDLLWAWKVVKHVKSNAIVLVKNHRLLGVGAGQMSRVDAVKLARMKAGDAGHDLDGAVMASDAFFPFPDGIEVAAAAGIRAVIQPGGSIRDQQVIDAARELGLAMLLTGIRHFKH